MKTSSLRKLILVPTMLALIILLGAFAISAYWNQKKDIRDEVETKLESVEKLFKVLLDVNASMMGAALKVIMRDSELKAAFRAKDRESLYNQSSPLFEQLRSGHGITHFYFTDPSRVNLLRAHKQDMYGDIIDRFTTLEAEKTGRLSYGIELGPLGTFTLRVVAPWHDGERLIGYVELGTEVEQIIDELRKVLGVELYVFIKKKFLDRQDWEASMNKLGRDPDWNRLPSRVLTAGTLKIIPEELIRFIGKEHHPHEISDIEISLDGQIYVAKCVDLKDAAGRSVGDLVVMNDVTKKVADVRKSVFLIGIFCLGIGGALFTFFYVFLGRVEKQLSETQRRVLELEQDRSKFILDNLPEHISRIDKNGCFDQWSPYSEKMFGYTSDEAIGRLRPEDVMQNPENAINMASAVKQKGFAEREIRGLRKDGTLPWLKFRMIEMHERDGTTSVLAIAEDITSRKQAEAALEESEKRYRTILESIEEIYFEVDIAGNFTFFNDSLSKSLGYSNEELMVMNNRDYMPPDSAKKIYNLFNQIYKTANPIKKMTYEIIRKDGSRGFHELSASLMKDQAGQPIGFRGIAHDITERKLAEELLELRTKQWQNTFDAIKDMIVIVNKDRQIVQINQAARDTFPDLGSQRPCYEIFHGVRVLPEGCVSCNVFETGQPVVSEYYDPRLTKWFDLYAYPIENVGGEVEQSVHVFRDITQQMKEAEEKERLTLRIQRSEKMETMGTLAGGVAHDLNNILGSIVGYPDLLLMDLPEDSKLRKPILAIQQSGQKATAVVQDLLTLARRGVVVNEVVNLNEIITEYLKSPEFDGLKTYYTDIQIQTNLKADLLNILGSPVHLSKTVMNLVSNAAEAITGKGTVKISSDHRYIDTPIRGYDKIEEGDYVVLEVTDDGMGISSEHIDKIFEPFYTKKKMGRSGTGLGMAVVWGTVKDHKGYIDVQSTEGKGTVFSLYFPVTRKEVMERITTGSIEDYLGNGESILVVDDVEEQRELASGMLEKLGYSVSTVSSGEEAVEYLKNNKTDLIVLDMIMDPGIDGLETYKQILEMYPGQKAIIASGFSLTEPIKEAQRLGAGTYIKKPFLLEKLGIAIKEELEK